MTGHYQGMRVLHDSPANLIKCLHVMLMTSKLTLQHYIKVLGSVHTELLAIAMQKMGRK